MIKITIMQEGDKLFYDSLPAFLATLTPGDLTTALATILELDREALSNAVIALQYAALVEVDGQ